MRESSTMLNATFAPTSRNMKIAASVASFHQSAPCGPSAQATGYSSHHTAKKAASDV
jgi:hypothetical protein